MKYIFNCRKNTVASLNTPSEPVYSLPPEVWHFFKDHFDNECEIASVCIKENSTIITVNDEVFKK